jgi:hypothetical protein
VSLALGLPCGTESPETAADVKLVRELLKLPAGPPPYLIAYGNSALGSRDISIVTRSVLAILSDLGAEIEVPVADVTSGTTKPAIQLVGGETRPIVLIHASNKIQGSAYSAVSYRGSQYWIDDADFDSKYALTVVQDLMALAEETDTSHAPIVTVAANY